MRRKVFAGLATHPEIGDENPDPANEQGKKQRPVGFRVGHENEGGDADGEKESGAAHTARLGRGSAVDVSDSVLVRDGCPWCGNVPLSERRDVPL